MPFVECLWWITLQRVAYLNACLLAKFLGRVYSGLLVILSCLGGMCFIAALNLA